MKTRIMAAAALVLIAVSGCGNCNLFRKNRMHMAPMQPVQCVPVQCVPVQTVAPQQVCPEPTVGPTL